MTVRRYHFKGQFCFIYILLALVAALLATACNAHRKPARNFIAQYGIIDPIPSNFKHCYDHGCRSSDQVHLDHEQWNEIRNIFQPAPADAATERLRITHAVGLLEKIVGRITGTEKDIGLNLYGTFLRYQMDCIDEAINTSTYLTMMESDGLIRYHSVLEPGIRGYIIFGLPHYATIIEEKENGDQYVVDSWFLDNGEPPFIVPFQKWRKGWGPKDKL